MANKLFQASGLNKRLAHSCARGCDCVGAFLRQRHVVNVDNAWKRAALRAACYGQVGDGGLAGFAWLRAQFLEIHPYGQAGFGGGGLCGVTALS